MPPCSPEWVEYDLPSPGAVDAADELMRLRERGWAPYRLRLEPEQNAWIAVVIDWQRAA